MMKKYLIYSFFLIVCSVALAGHAPLESYKLQFLRENSNQKITIFLTHLPRPDGEPLILSHPLALNNLAVRKMGEKLWNLGFDVWLPNTRGHGVGEKRSIIEPYEDGDYGVDHVITEDWPSLLQALYKKTGKKISIMGYSMGGMTWYQTLSGVYRTSKGVFQSDRIARQRAKMVKNLVLLATPPDLTQVSSVVSTSLFLISPFFRPFSFFLPITTDDAGQDNQSKVSYLETFRRNIMSFASPFIPSLAPQGLIARENISTDDSEQKELMIKHVSALHTDCLQDFLRWLREPYRSRDGSALYGEHRKAFVPTLLIFPSEDTLIPANYGVQEAQKIIPRSQVKILIAKGFGHLDIGLKKGVDLMMPAIASFFKYSSVANLQTEFLYEPDQQFLNSPQ